MPEIQNERQAIEIVDFSRFVNLQVRSRIRPSN